MRKLSPLVSLLLIVGGILALPVLAAPATLPPAPVALVAGDTLHASPWVQDTLGKWSPTDARMLCVTSFAEWPGYLYIRHVEDAGSTRCEGSTMAIAQLPVCPTQQDMNDAPPGLIVQCGPAVFKRNKDHQPPAGPAVRIA